MPYRYEIKSCLPSELTAADLAACIALIKSGDAVDPDSATTELPHAMVLAVARSGEEIVGVGAIKRVREMYAARISARSRADFNPRTAELGYVAVDSDHRRQGLSPRLVAALVSKHAGPLFATTDNELMKKTLAKAGFIQKGEEWNGQKGRLTLWIRE